MTAHPVTLTFGSNHTDADQQEEAEAQGEQEEAGSRAEMLQEGLGRRQPCKRRRPQDKEDQDRRETAEEERPQGPVREEGWCRESWGEAVVQRMPRSLTALGPAQSSVTWALTCLLAPDGDM